MYPQYMLDLLYSHIESSYTKTEINELIARYSGSRICELTGNADDGFDYASGSSYTDITDALTAGISIYIKANNKFYHLIYHTSGTVSFANLTGTTLELFTIGESDISYSTTPLATGAALTAAVNNWLATYDTMGLQTDIFQYAKGRIDSLKDEYVTPMRKEINNA